MTEEISIEEIETSKTYIWKIIKSGTVKVSGIAESWLEALEEASIEFKKEHTQ